MTEIKYVDYGVANRINGRIEMHKDLQNYPDLHAWILFHEERHNKSENYTWDDFKLDAISKTPAEMFKTVLKFMIVRPKTWIQLSPVYPSEGEYYLDRSKLFFWSVVMVGLLAMAVWI